MRTVLDTAASPAHDAFVEKKSEFIGDACHVASVDEALAFVDKIREQHPKSRHVAYAALVSGPDGRLIERMSDDGEPSGTAGKPILDVLRANDLIDSAVAVTRYFGGILLGSGGLIRAYSTGASLAVKAATVAEIVECRRVAVTLEYAQLGPFANLLSSLGGEQEHAEFTDRVAVTAIVPQAVLEQFHQRLTDLFHGSVAATEGDLLLRPAAR